MELIMNILNKIVGKHKKKKKLLERLILLL